MRVVGFEENHQSLVTISGEVITNSSHNGKVPFLSREKKTVSTSKKIWQNLGV